MLGDLRGALEHLTVSLAAQMQHDGISVRAFRIDIPVASEGFIANAPGIDHSNREPGEVAAEGIIWMLRQPASYTGHNDGMAALREEHGIMATRVGREHRRTPGILTKNPMRLPN